MELLVVSGICAFVHNAVYATTGEEEALFFIATFATLIGSGVVFVYAAVTAIRNRSKSKKAKA